MRYLIIDDDPTFCATLSRAIERRGHVTASAENSEQALATITEFTPERIVLDLKLGTESGLAVLKQIMALETAAQVLMLTGYSSIPTAVEATKLGAVNYLCKPVGVADILAAFEKTSADESVPVEAQPPSVNRLEWEHIQRVLQQHDGNISSTARALGMHRRTLQRKLQKRPVRR